jgi:hypothetical protein
MGGTHFPIKTPEKVKTEMRLHALAYTFLFEELNWGWEALDTECT